MEMVSCLLIDRNEGERHKLSGFLADMGITCAEVPAAEDGLRYCREHMPDVVVMDATELPDALEFLRRALRRNGRRPVVIFYADAPDFETVGETLLDGAAEFLVKPFDRDLLRFKLRQSGVLVH